MNFTDSSLATSISDLFLRAIAYNERRQQRDEKVLLARVKQQQELMQIARGRVSGLLSTYHTTASHHASDLLQALCLEEHEQRFRPTSKMQFTPCWI
jgi:hypothetical protein